MNRIFIIASLAVVALAGDAAKDKPKRPAPHVCDPYAEHCPACKDCSACRHCSKLGGKCSVCFKK